MELVDTHAHLNDERLRPQLERVLLDARSVGIVAMIAVGTTYASSVEVHELAQTHDPIHAAVGIQPNYCHECEPEDWDRIVALARQPKVVALGETGLARCWHDCPCDLQQD